MLLDLGTENAKHKIMGLNRKLPPEKRIKQKGKPIDYQKHPGMAIKCRNIEEVNKRLMPKELMERINKDGYTDLRQVSLEYGPKIFLELCDLALNSENEDTRLKAGAFITERIYGKAVQPIIVDANVRTTLAGIIALPMPETITAEIVEETDEELINGPETETNHNTETDNK